MAKMKLGKIPTNEILGIVIGGVAAKFLVDYLNKPDSVAANWNNKVKAALPLVAGVVISMQKNPIVKGVGFGMIAKGAADSATAFIGQYDPATDDLLGAYDEDYMSLPADQSILSLPADQSILSAADEEFIGADEDILMNGLDEEDF